MSSTNNSPSPVNQVIFIQVPSAPLFDRYGRRGAIFETMIEGRNLLEAFNNADSTPGPNDINPSTGLPYHYAPRRERQVAVPRGNLSGVRLFFNQDNEETPQR